jgi:hypothetical protein
MGESLSKDTDKVDWFEIELDCSYRGKFCLVFLIFLTPQDRRFDAGFETLAAHPNAIQRCLNNKG